MTFRFLLPVAKDAKDFGRHRHCDELEKKKKKQTDSHKRSNLTEKDLMSCYFKLPFFQRFVTAVT